ncbi:NADP-specific glutamate dehydrogenase [Psychrobacter sp.]|uniref:NADP-specific glutamate dehydrogenase n=1 Tax=Psychrobacter sp. TaxID=56811 RepID=UPI0026490374|nr:NADP-specific glutamate dehydrogenase [Psychrobacter sp.]MDN6275327.1 NADP-specific glutamate dehydrogenase [Psychrobacter sp.]MDN6308329.1 NADP-specific glutamate dehydrogenase [Psychrobacter sp.]
MSISQAIEKVEARYSHQPEFVQAVKEVASTIAPLYDAHPEYQQMKIFERLVEPDRIICFRINWEDDQGEVQVNRGWRVQFSNALGPYKGGVRFHPTVTQSVLKFLGFEQIFKNALTGLPMGGGKGGADFDPKGKSDSEIRRFCYAFMRELHHYVSKDIDVPAGDIGVGGREVSYMFAMYKNLTREYGGVLTGKGVGFGGSLMRTEATGYGAVYFLENMLTAQNESIEGKKVLISGAGNVSLHAAEKATMLGASVVTVSDSQGTLYDEAGLNQEKIDWLKAQKAKSKPLAEYVDVYGGEWFAKQKPWHIKGDIAIPSATQNEVNGEDAKLMVENGIKYVVEGANMPLTADAVDHIRVHRVHYAPGKAANAGGVAVSALEMSQNSVRQYKTFEQIDDRLKSIMKNIHDSAADASNQYDKTDKGYIDYMAGANLVGFKRVADALIAYGILN